MNPPVPPQPPRKKGTGPRVNVSAAPVTQNENSNIERPVWVSQVWLHSGYKNSEQWKNPDRDMIFLARDKLKGNGEVTKEYNIVKDIQQLKRNIELTPQAECCFYEQFHDNQHVKLYFDFEIKGPFAPTPTTSESASNSNTNFMMSDDADFVQQALPTRPSNKDISERLDHICDRAIRKIQEIYGIELQKDWFAFMNSSNENKISFHVILTKGIYFTNCNELKKFFSENLFPKEYLNNPNEYPDFIGLDPGVYGKGRLFRLPLCTKLGEMRPLVMDERFSFEDQVVVHCPLEHGRVVDNVVVKRLKSKTNKRKADEALINDDSAKIAEKMGKSLKELLMLIQHEKAEDYNFWIETGMKFKRAGGQLEDWQEWTNKYFEWKGEKSAREGKLESKWAGFDSSYDLHLFLEHVRKHVDNGDMRVKEFVKGSLEHVGILHNEIGDAFHIHHDMHMYSNGCWYFFDGTRWKKDFDGMWLSRNILGWHNELNARIAENRKKLEEEYPQFKEEEEEIFDDEPKQRNRLFETVSNDGNIQDLTPEQRKECREIVKFNKKLRFIKKITQDGTIGNNNALKAIYFNETFFDELDSLPDLLGVKNGVIDLTKTDNIDLDSDDDIIDIFNTVFRKSTSNDKITLTTGYDIPDKIEGTQILQAKRDINRLFECVYPDVSVRKYILRFHASLLTARCPDEFIHFYTGMNSAQTGANGKSTIDLLNLKVLGEYAVVGHPSLLTNGRESANSANSALMAIKNKRYVSFQEINDPGNGKVTLNMQIIKNLTGGDPQTGRDLHERQSRPFDQTWKIVVSANKLPPMSNDDGGSRRRVRDIPHEAKFVKNPSNPKYQGIKYLFEADTTLKDRIKNKENSDNTLILAYLALLLKEHKQWRQDGLIVCERVEAHTLAYLNDQDIFRTWMEEFVKYTGKAEDTIERSVMEATFMAVRTSSQTDTQIRSIRNKESFINELSLPQRMGPLNEFGVWTGWKYINDQYLTGILRNRKTSPTISRN